MSDLDQKLSAIVEEAQSYIDDDDLLKSARDIAIEQIKKCFEEAGYFALSQKGMGERLVNTVKSQEGLMTGQEWYDRLQKELAGMVIPYKDQPHDAQMAFNLLNEAARRAAGLSNE